MAKDLNKVQLTGRLGADVDMRSTNQGSAVATFRVASNRAWNTAGGERREDAEWFRIVAWGNLAKICYHYLSKGSRIYVEGRLQTRSWHDERGQTHWITEVIANELIILDGRHEGHGYTRDDHEEPMSDESPISVSPLVKSNSRAAMVRTQQSIRQQSVRPAPKPRSERFVPVSNDDDLFE